MTVHLSSHPLTYISVPKCACTSLKHFFFEIENGFAFRRFRINGDGFNVHQFAKSVEFSTLRRGRIKGHVRIAVVRDPVSRIVSCYSNKVIGNRVLDRQNARAFLDAREMTLTPTIAEFVRNLPLYQQASPTILHHSRPLRYFLGADPGYFGRIFSIREVSEVPGFVSRLVGDVPDLPHVQRSSSAQALEDLPEAGRRRIETMFAEDIDLFGSYM